MKDRFIHQEKRTPILLNKYSKYRIIVLIVCMLVAVLTACQAETPEEEVCPIDLTTGEFTEDCLPILDEDGSEATAYPVEEIIIDMSVDSAYPIAEADLSLLLKTWRLTTYAEDGVESNPALKFWTFYDDGSYTIANEPDSITGNWTTVLRMEDAILILDPGTDQEVYYQITSQGEAELKLRTWQGEIQIEEGYIPDSSG